MRAVNKWLVRILLIAVLSPGMAVADGFYDEEEGPQPIPPGPNDINMGGPTVTADENGNVNVDVGTTGYKDADVFGSPGFIATHGRGCIEGTGPSYQGCENTCPNQTSFSSGTCVIIGFGKLIQNSGSTLGQSSSSSLSSAYVVSNPQQLLDFIHVQTTASVKDDSANKQKIVDELNDELRLVGGVAALMVPTQANGTVVEKTIALGIPSGLYVSQDAFTADASQLTPAGIQFFNQIKLYGSDIAVVTGSADRINLIKTQLIANGVLSDQVLMAPAAKMKNPNTVAVYVIRLPTMADLFVPANSGNN